MKMQITLGARPALGPAAGTALGLLVAGGLTCASAELDTLWTRTFGGAAADGARGVCATSDGGLVLAGYTYSGSAGETDVLLIRTDCCGQTVWQRTIGGAGRDYGHSVCATGDGGYALAGFTSSWGAGNLDVLVVKTDAQGVELWRRTYGGPAADAGHAICATGDGCLLVAGRTESYGAGLSDMYVLKLAADGDTLWTRTFGGADTDRACDVCVTADGGYVVGGIDGSATDLLDFATIKLRPDGSVWWSQRFGGATNADWGLGLCPTTDGGVVLAGFGDILYYELSDVYAVCYSATGSYRWSRRCGESDYYDYACSVCPAEDGYLFCGATKNAQTGRNDLYLVRVNALGVPQWTQSLGGARSEWGHRVIALGAGRYAVAGYTEETATGRPDAWLLELHDPAAAQHVEETSAAPHVTMARPAGVLTGEAVLGFTLRQDAEVRLDILDVAGRRVAGLVDGRLAGGEHEAVWHAGPCGTGVYCCRLRVDGEELVQRLVLVR